MLRAIAFDMGGVLASPPSLLPKLAALAGVTAAEFGEHYWTGRDEYDAGASDEQYWGAVLDALGVAPDERLISQLAGLDASVWSELRPAAWQLLRDCKAASVTVAVLSNTPRSMETAARAAPWWPDVDHLFASATLGLMKPDPRIYRHVAEQLGLPGDQIAFIDDKQDNVDGALAAGWNAHLWVSDDDTRAWLVEIGVL